MRKVLILDRSEDLAEQARSAVAELEDVEVVPCTRVGSVEHLHEHEGPFDVLVAGPSLATRTGLRRLAHLRREDPAMSVVLSFATRPDATLREIVQVGAEDVLELPAEDATLRAAIKRALDLSAGRHAVVVAAPASEDVVAAPAAKGRVFTISSPTGGCGKTFYATNFAYFLATHTRARVVLVDLDLQFGEITMALRLQPQQTIYDVLKDEHEADGSFDLAAHIEDYLVPSEGFAVLTAPKEPSQADAITPLEVTRIIEALRSRFDYVVVDTPAALAETVLAAFDLSEHLFVIAAPDLPSVRNLSLFLQTLEKLRIPADNLSLVLNKIERDVGVDIDQIVGLFPQGFRSRLPYAKEASRSINFGKPVVAAYPDTEIARLLAEGMREFVPGEARPVAAPEPVRRAGRLGRLLRRPGVAVGR